MLLYWSAILFAIALLTVVAFVAIRIVIFRAFAPPGKTTERRCLCGYSLKGLQLPRCPECGRAIGFDKTFDEMGISREELRDPNHPGP